MTDPGTDLTMIVPTAGRAGALGSLLGDLTRQEPPVARVLVVDAMRVDECQRLVAAFRAEHPGFPLQHLPAPPGETGLPASRNVGVRHADTSLVAFLDDDTRVGPDYCRRLAEPFGADPELAGVGGYIVDEAPWRDDPETPADPRTPVISGGWFRLDGRRRPLPRRTRLRRALGLALLDRPGRWSGAGHDWPVSYWPPGDDWVEVDFVMGGASAWRRSVFQEARFPAELDGYGHYEDLIFCLQVRRLGHRIVLHRGARLEHHHDPDARPDYRRYGRQVTRHGWSLWRQFRDLGTRGNAVGYWATELANAVSRLPSPGGVQEALGRFEGALAGLRDPIRFAPLPALTDEGAER
jgi:GT2 family glycosyltransferase